MKRGRGLRIVVAGGLLAAGRLLALSACRPAARTEAEAPPTSTRATEQVVLEHMEALHRAGDADRCHPEVARVRAALRDDGRLGDAQLRAALAAHDYRGKGSMPYPSKGTACALFGIVDALEGALKDRGTGP